jgi:D-xylose 1-dehydrogenase (NADP+, D-xylono-1,5-lactone-forming)
MHAAEGATLQAAAARDVTRARALEPAGPSYADYDALLDDPSVNAVYISLTNDVHAHWAIEAMRRGKHFLCEKPLAMTAAEVDTMVAVAEETGRLLVEASWYRWHPRVRLAAQMLADGAVGTVRHVAAGFTFAGELDGNYRLEPARGGGALYDVGCYAISAAQWAFGSPVTEVVARQELGPSGVDLATEAVLTFDGGEAEVRAAISEPPRQWLVITGDGGEIELRDAAYTAWARDESVLLVSDGTQTRRIPVPAVDAYRVMVAEVSAAIADGSGWVVPLAESRETAAVIDACMASARAGSRPENPVLVGAAGRDLGDQRGD